ncbi:GTP binding domain, P-loop containing nucleoside triphosphate hydrolase [Artemisia annua]|uniref:GTP binding domain, P-loop containing nucleoside triphosphate hydrolase n=1 Tax=Artemisia annua TaxID=35608 RepID=A0A2U1M8T5_ARTAN|nr:GTP binding domain, P-loop containing nucleoside triphosphate hydrolase [Artemisia annua]
MGGDTVSSPASTDDDTKYSESDDGENWSFEIEANERRKKSVYDQVVKSYDELNDRVVNLELAKAKILSYTPGSWVENVGGMTVSDYKVPKTTTLLLIGPKGSGKSSLINRISRVFEDDKFAPERAQVTYNSSAGDGTCFLREYMIPRDSTSFCLYDTRSFSNDLYENLQMIRRWMTKGVRHGKLVRSASDNSNFQARMKHKSGQDKLLSYKSRTVNFVIFVVNGLSVLKCINSNGSDTLYTQMVANTFSSPFLSFKDHKPAIAITHGDLLSISERARVRVYLGELLGVHSSKQTFDIPDNCEPATELAIVDMVRYALEHADMNLPRQTRPKITKARMIYGYNIQLWTCLLLLLAAGMFIFTAHLPGFSSFEVHPESVPKPCPEIKKSMEVQPEIVLEPGLEIKKSNEVHQESVHKQSPKIKKVTELHQESILKPSPKIEKVTEVHQENVLEPSPEIKKAMEVHQERFLNPTLNIKKSMEFQPEIVLETSSKIKKVMEVYQESVLEPSLEIKKVIDVHQESAPEPSVEIKKPSLETKKLIGVHQESVPELSMEIKKLTLEIKRLMEVQPASVPKWSPGIKKVTEAQPESVPGPSLEKKKVSAERVHRRGQKIKKGRAGHVPEPAMEIDWKKIRHLWYK